MKQYDLKEGIPVIQFDSLKKMGICHGFSTKLGGVSIGDCATMNMSFTRGDREEDVRENHRRFANAVGYPVQNLVLSNQVHDTKIHKVTKEDAGKGYTKESDLMGIDGLVTNEKDIPLMIFGADCVPLFFADVNRGVVAAAHAGWRGTVAGMARKMIECMEQEYGCQLEQIHTVIGPSICQKCYEVSEDVIQKFKEVFPKTSYQDIFYQKEDGKYQLDLWNANKYMMMDAGIREDNIEVSGICTCCNHDILFSHRYTNGRRGNLSGVIML